MKPIIAITPGDPAGVGPELLQKALASWNKPSGVTWEVVDGSGTRRAGEITKFRPGVPTREGAALALAALEEAVAGCHAGRYQGLVTGPVSKEWLVRAGFEFPGQTEFLAERCGLHTEAVTMAMVSKPLNVFLTTTHLPLVDAIAGINRERLERTIAHARAYLQACGVAQPRLAVAGLNPHAGENGLLGNEERFKIGPLLRRVEQRLGLTEPLPIVSADTLFYHASRGRYDGVICLYHDQGLIPFKLIAFETGVNCTLGLPFPRCSADHGTAFDIAGRGVADERSLLEAMQLCAKLAKAGVTSSWRSTDADFTEGAPAEIATAARVVVASVKVAAQAKKVKKAFAKRLAKVAAPKKTAKPKKVKKAEPKPTKQKAKKVGKKNIKKAAASLRKSRRMRLKRGAAGLVASGKR